MIFDRFKYDQFGQIRKKHCAGALKIPNSRTCFFPIAGDYLLNQSVQCRHQKTSHEPSVKLVVQASDQKPPVNRTSGSNEAPKYPLQFKIIA